MLQRKGKDTLETNPMIPAASTPVPETITVPEDADSVCCDGGGGALGHPAVYYSFDGRDSVECGYCDRVFVKG